MIPLHDDNPSSTLPLVTVGLIVICVLVFLWEISLGERAMEAAVFDFGVTPATLLGTAHLPAQIYAAQRCANAAGAGKRRSGFAGATTR